LLLAGLLNILEVRYLEKYMLDTKIKILPDAIINRIAAGEVVERPSSVVKELVENSLDAGASSITVELEESGRRLIRVSDDGAGMNSEDLRLSVERHATSKLDSGSDLFAIATLGFRGEALPSIASVSHFTIRSRARDADFGAQITVEGGRISEVQDAGCPPGTEIEVRGLFYNTPARRKFLKSDSTERAHVTETMQRFALANMHVRFQLKHDGRLILNLPAVEELHERVAAVLGRELYPHLFPINKSFGALKIIGMLSSPEKSRPSQNALHLFLNGRPINDRSLKHAVTSAYGSMLQGGRYPVSVLLLEVPHDTVDVNVHPQKTEVRFSDPRGIYNFLHEAVRETLGASPWLGGAMPQTRTQLQERVSNAIRTFSTAGTKPYSSGFSFSYGASSRIAEKREVYASHEIKQREPQGSGFFSSLIPLAQLDNTYILCQSHSGLVLVDQHAAHERINFERLKAAFASGESSAQTMLFPLRMDLNAIQEAALEDFYPQLERMGFLIDPFGGNSYAVKAAPPILANADVGAALKDLLDEAASFGGSRAVQERIEHALSTVACHASVRAHDKLSFEQMESLLHRLDGIDFSGNCPHGRPVYFEMTYEEMERRFGRTT